MKTENVLEQFIKDELATLKADLKNGDETLSEITGSGKEIKTSKKTGDARMRVISQIRDMLIEKQITAAEATQATQLFGKKTKALYWIK